MGDVRNGRLVHVHESADVTSPVGKLTLMLDDVMDALMPGGTLHGDELRQEERFTRIRIQGRAQGLAAALSVITCYSEDEVRQQMKVRWQQRQEQGR
jgi:hypothetical protein